MGITPETVKSSIKNILSSIYEADYWTVSVAEEVPDYGYDEETLQRLEGEMKEAARNLDFERAAVLRDKIKEIKGKIIELGVQSPSENDKQKKKKRKREK